MTANHLADAASAYLRSAAHQPIHWFPWGSEAFTAARGADKPVLLDIGAVWCHWCHVMDGESYENAELAAFLNEHFVCIKVDRDERPDVDTRYQRAVQALTQQGGWPLTAFLTPDGEVFYGGTYFPPDGRYGRPGFQSVLASVLEAYRGRPNEVRARALAIRRAVDQQLDEAKAGELSPGLLGEAVRQIGQVFDPVHGGFGRQPKFPHPGALQLLMRRWADAPDEALRQIIDTTLYGMARGGIHDQLGGGFHRYSVDAEWIVPHFEKMAYDNAELLKVYCDAYTLFDTVEYADVARGIVRWVKEVASDPEGGYAASQDADVGLDDDGDYFTWTRDEAAAVLTPDELEAATAYYDIGTAGEMHHNPGKNVLFVSTSVAVIARRMGQEEAAIRLLLEEAKRKLREARARRPAPFVDRTRYTNWNAMLASAMLRAGAVLDDEWARAHALATLLRLRSESAEPDAVAHTPSGVPGLLDDQVLTAAAALDAYEATGDLTWLAWGEALMERVWRDYWDAEGGGLFDVARGSGGEGLLPSRLKPVQDTPTPSPNGVAGATAARLYEFTGQVRWQARAASLVQAFAGRAAELGMHAAAYLLAVDWVMNPVTHLAVVGDPLDLVTDRMHRTALATYFPRCIVQRLAPGALDTDARDRGARDRGARDAAALPPALAGMVSAADGTAARGYACTGTSCAAPAEDEAAWAATLARLTMRASQR